MARGWESKAVAEQIDEQVWLFVYPTNDAHALRALHNELNALLVAHHALNHYERADIVEV
jgi:deoxycytidylate deaminase